MAVSIIYLIIILLILRKVLKDKKRAANPKSPVNSQKIPYGGQAVLRPESKGASAQGKDAGKRESLPSQRKNAGNSGKDSSQPYANQVYKSQPKTDYQQQQQMRELKNRLEKKYKPVYNSSILENAKVNVAENDADLLKEADRKWHEAAKASVLHTEEYTDVLKQVYDLMAVGYSGNLKFDRDFLSEGIDMINRIGMTESNMDIIEYKINRSI